MGLIRQYKSEGKWQDSQLEMYDVSLTPHFDMGTEHFYYDGPHCMLDLGFLHFYWRNWNCKKCHADL